MKILIGYDGSSSADAAIEDLRKAGLPAQAEALVVCVAEGNLPAIESGAIDSASEDSWKSRLAEAESLAQKAADRIGFYFPRWTVTAEALWGSPARIILDTSAWWHPDLLVVGSHGRSPIVRLFLGSVSLELIHKASCSVRVTRARESSDADGPIRMIIGNDGSIEADAVIRAVAARSWPKGAEAQVISVVQTLVPAVATLEASTYAQEPAFTVIREVDERERIRLLKVSEDSANILRRAGLVVTSTVVDGDPREVILAEAELSNSDAIFVGALVWAAWRGFCSAACRLISSHTRAAPWKSCAGKPDPIDWRRHATANLSVGWSNHRCSARVSARW